MRTRAWLRRVVAAACLAVLTASGAAQAQPPQPPTPPPNPEPPVDVGVCSNFRMSPTSTVVDHFGTSGDISILWDWQAPDPNKRCVGNCTRNACLSYVGAVTSSSPSWLRASRSDAEVDYFVDPNDTYVDRRARLRVSGVSGAFTVDQDGQTCKESPDSTTPASVSVGANGGTVSVRANGPPACDWQTRESESWIDSLSPSRVKGRESVTFNVSANSGGPRSGTVRIGNRSVTVTQDAASCPSSPSVSPTSLSFGSGSDSKSVTVNEGSHCSYSVGDNRGWITRSGSTVSGGGSVTVTVTTNSGGQRTGSVTVGSTSVSVTQAAASCPSSPTVTPSSLSFGSGSGSSSLSVGGGSHCSYSVSDNRGWISRSTSSVSGGGSVTVSVTTNSGGQRTGSVTVGSTSVSVTQSGASCPSSPTVTPGSLSFGNGTGSSSLSVGGGSHCSYSVSDDRGWISRSTSTVSGGGTVTVSVTSNSGAERTGTVTVGGTSVSVTQASGVSCPSSPTVTPGSLSFGNGTGSSTVAVGGDASCTFAVSAAETWLTATPGSVSGGGSVTVSVVGNEGAERTGSVAVGDASVSVTQAAGACRSIPTVTPSELSFVGDGGSSAVAVGGWSGCGPYAVSTAETWLTAAPASVVGGETVTVSAAANESDASRTGAVTVGGAGVSVTQAAPCPSGPTGTLLVGGQVEVTEGGGVVMTFVTGRSDCRWPVSTTADWVTVHTASVSGGGMLRFAVAVNAWGARTGAVTVGSLGLTVLQASDPGAPVWTDPVLTAGVTLVKAVHMTELRTRVDGVRAGCGLTGAVWTDPTLTVGVTAVKAAHMRELRTAVEEARTACGGTAPSWTDPVLTVGVTAVKAAHVTELRTAVEGLERGQ